MQPRRVASCWLLEHRRSTRATGESRECQKKSGVIRKLNTIMGRGSLTHKAMNRYAGIRHPKLCSRYLCTGLRLCRNTQGSGTWLVHQMTEKQNSRSAQTPQKPMQGAHNPKAEEKTTTQSQNPWRYPCKRTKTPSSNPKKQSTSHHSSGSPISSPRLVLGTGAALTSTGFPGCHFPLRYPEPSNQGVSLVLRPSNEEILSLICIVNPISSKPLTRQCLRNSSTSKLANSFPEEERIDQSVYLSYLG